MWISNDNRTNCTIIFINLLQNDHKIDLLNNKTKLYIFYNNGTISLSSDISSLYFEKLKINHEYFLSSFIILHLIFKTNLFT